MMRTNTVDPIFQVGDEVVLAEGTYQGTPGVFLRLTRDLGWADISERNGGIRAHPLVWLAHAPKPQPGAKAESQGNRPVAGHLAAWEDEGGAASAAFPVKGSQV